MRERGRARPMQGVLAMAAANFDSWLHSPRTIIMLVFIAAICYLQMCGYRMTLEETGYTMHMGETLFYEFNFGCNMPMTTALFLVMVSELPRRIAFQQYALVRSSRMRWMAAQVVYCMMMVAAMLLLILLCITLLALPLITPGTGWSDAQRIAAGVIEPQEALIEPYIMARFTPATALLAAMLPMMFFWLTMVLVILLFGVWGAPVVGVVAYRFIVVAHVTIYFEYFPIPMSMPMHFATLRTVMSGYEGEEMRRLVGVAAGYLALIAALVGAMLLRVRGAELNFYAENRF